MICIRVRWFLLLFQPTTRSYSEVPNHSMVLSTFWVQPQAYSNLTVSYRRSSQASSNSKVRPLFGNSHSTHGIVTVLKSQYGFRKNRAPMNSNVLSKIFRCMFVTTGVYSTRSFQHIWVNYPEKSGRTDSVGSHPIARSKNSNGCGCCCCCWWWYKQRLGRWKQAIRACFGICLVFLKEVHGAFHRFEKEFWCRFFAPLCLKLLGPLFGLPAAKILQKGVWQARFGWLWFF